MHSEDTTPQASPGTLARDANLDRGEAAGNAIGNPRAPFFRHDLAATSCGESSFSTTMCRAAPAMHPSRKFALGCGRYACGGPTCQRKWLSRRKRLVWDARLVHFPAALLHFVLTVPATLRQCIVDVKGFRRTGRELVDGWMRRWYAVGDDEKLFVLDVFHPAGDKAPEVWAPHANLFVVARVLTSGGRLRPISAYASREALGDLRDCWATAVSGFVGVEAPVCHVHLSVHSRPHDRRFAIMRELRSFPGWEAKDLSRIIWAGAFGPRVWSRTRAALGIADRRRTGERCKAGHLHNPGETCGAPLVPFPSLPDAGRGQVRAAEERDGVSLLEGWERTHDDHRATLPRCTCEACRRGQTVRTPSLTALAATRRAAEYAREIATNPKNFAAVGEGGALFGAVAAVQANYEAIQEIVAPGITVEEAKDLRIPFLDFIRLADEAIKPPDTGVSWQRRLRAIYAARADDDERVLAATGEWQVTINLAWV